MPKRIFQLLLVAGLAASSLGAANEPFVGKWKVNPSKSKLNDEIKVEVAGANKYALTFGPGQVDTVVADGSDQPALSGTTLSITVKGPNRWELIRKLKGRTLLTAEWTLSEDGKTLNDAFTQYLPSGMTLFSQPLPDGSRLLLPYVYERTAGNSGFPGTWDSESAKVKTGLELQVQPYEGDGLSFKRSDEEMVKKFKLDGNDYPDLDAGGADKGTAYSGRRVDERIVEITFKLKGKTTSTRQIELSTELKTLTMTERLVGESRPKSVLVFDRATLTSERAGSLAQQLANEKAQSLYQCQPFQKAEPAQFIEDHWFWHQIQGQGRSDLEAKVEFKPDGAEPKVTVTRLESVPIIR